MPKWCVHIFSSPTVSLCELLWILASNMTQHISSSAKCLDFPAFRTSYLPFTKKKKQRCEIPLGHNRDPKGHKPHDSLISLFTSCTVSRCIQRDGEWKMKGASSFTRKGKGWWVGMEINEENIRSQNGCNGYKWMGFTVTITNGGFLTV